MSITKADITTKIESILSPLATNRKLTASDINELKRVTDNLVDYVLALPVIPEGGTTGQVLTKTSNTDFDVEWATPL